MGQLEDGAQQVELILFALFQLRHGADPEDTILNAFKVFDPEGKETLKKDLLCDLSLQMEQMFTTFPPDVAGHLDFKNLVYIITHGEEKDHE
eukprot:XP_014026880.1 PREDICTED: myosin regulatory light chain 2, ventricular/cardiac muscle isoform-like [Salmo salar]